MQSCDAGVLQVPEPLQLEALWCTKPRQIKGEHWMVAGHCSQTPPVAQKPSAPQVVCAVAAHMPLEPPPVFVVPQTPLAPLPLSAAEHDVQVPLQAVSQHTPSTQLPVAHVEAEEQAAPLPWRQLPAPLQRSGAAHVPGSG